MIAKKNILIIRRLQNCSLRFSLQERLLRKALQRTSFVWLISYNQKYFKQTAKITALGFNQFEDFLGKFVCYQSKLNRHEQRTGGT